MARPTKYTPAILARAQEYAQDWEKIGDVIPMICGLACHIDIGKTTIHQWEKEEGKEEFADVCRRVREAQEKVLINKGLSKQSEASLSKLLLMKHGYSDRQAVDHTSTGEKIEGITVTFGKPE